MSLGAPQGSPVTRLQGEHRTSGLSPEAGLGSPADDGYLSFYLEASRARVCPKQASCLRSDALLGEKKDDLSPRKITMTLPCQMEENKVIVRFFRF